MSDLLPCPHCGAHLDVIDSQRGPDFMKLVKHPDRECLLAYQTWWLVPRFAALWNARAPAPPPADGGEK